MLTEFHRLIISFLSHSLACISVEMKAFNPSSLFWSYFVFMHIVLVKSSFLTYVKADYSDW